MGSQEVAEKRREKKVGKEREAGEFTTSLGLIRK